MQTGQFVVVKSDFYPTQIGRVVSDFGYGQYPLAVDVLSADGESWERRVLSDSEVLPLPQSMASV